MENVTAEEKTAVPMTMTVQEYIPMLLMNTAFEPGTCMEFIESLTDPDVKKMAYAEYYYFSGQHEKAVEYASPYLNHENAMVRMSACLIYSFANLSLNHICDARRGLDRLQDSLAQYAHTDQANKALLAFIGSASRVLLHLPTDGLPNIAESIRFLPEGIRFWGCYIMAHEAYLKQEYGQSLGIVQACQSMSTKIYPIAHIYLDLMGAMDAMNLRKTELAKKYFMDAWETARPDDLIEGIGEHHGLLQGLIETCMRDEWPEDYKRIIEITYRFSYGWRRIHNSDTNKEVADNLTTTEFTIAMLASRGWRNAEIAEHIRLSERTVKQHLSTVYTKLNIDKRSQLNEYMLR